MGTLSLREETRLVLGRPGDSGLSGWPHTVASAQALAFFLEECASFRSHLGASTLSFICFYGTIYIAYNLPFEAFLSVQFSDIKYMHNYCATITTSHLHNVSISPNSNSVLIKP